MNERTPLADRTIGEYLERLGSSHPDPGGSSVAGLVGALGAGLGQMVICLTRDTPELAPVNDRLQQMRDALLAASADDEAAYGSYLAASRLPKSTPEEKSARRRAMQAALIVSTDVPLGIARTANEILVLLEPVVATGSMNALSDGEIGVNLAEAAVIATLTNVRVNLGYIKDPERAREFADEATALEQSARVQAAQLRAIAEQRRG